ncbi:hypothetical protein MHYP_G00260820 [Metynnis hypsauchen]
MLIHCRRALAPPVGSSRFDIMYWEASHSFLQILARSVPPLALRQQAAEADPQGSAVVVMESPSSLEVAISAGAPAVLSTSAAGD